jgi:SAM-dependent methyltransferase
MTRPNKTDWNSYYCSPYKVAQVSRKFTGRALLWALDKFTPIVPHNELVIAELGGGNSCFYDLIVSKFGPREYHLVDNNQLSLDLFREKAVAGVKTECHMADVRDCRLSISADVVFSVGLIEHFDCKGTALAIRSHFALAKPGGTIIMTFPTPTFLYGAARWIAETLGIWIFHDERPLDLYEVVQNVAGFGSVIHTSIIWPTILTQGLVVITDCKKLIA